MEPTSLFKQGDFFVVYIFKKSQSVKLEINYLHIKFLKFPFVEFLKHLRNFLKYKKTLFNSIIDLKNKLETFFKI